MKTVTPAMVFKYKPNIPLSLSLDFLFRAPLEASIHMLVKYEPKTKKKKKIEKML